MAGGPRLAWALFLVVAVGVADNLSGVRLRVYPLYFLPISLAAWGAGRAAGIAVAALSALTWWISNELAGQPDPVAVMAFNTVAQLTAFSTVAVLIAAQRRQLDAERRLSRSDPLTGVANGRAFDQLATAELERSRRFRHPLTLAYMDLDNFKAYNDTEGHRRGDMLLQTFARALHGSIRITDTVARLGGDEFAVLLPETAADGALVALHKMHAAVLAVLPSGVGVTVGAVTFETVPRTVDDLIARTDAVMYEIKRAGKGALKHVVVAA